VIDSTPRGAPCVTPDWLTRRRLLAGGRTALVADGRVWTWRDLDRRVAAFAGALSRLGIGCGDRVALLAGNRPEFVVAVHALMRLGAVLVPLNVRLTASEIAWQIEDADVRLTLHDTERTDLAAAAAGAAARLDLAALGGDDAPAFAAPAAIDLDAIQAIVYTSGTSGRPKGALLPAGSWWWGACASALHLGHDPRDRWLAVLPLFHVGGLAILFRSVIAGVPVVLHSRFDPEQVRAAFSRDDVTLVSLVPAMLPPLFEAGGRFPVSLRVALLGGSGAAPALVERALDLGLPVAPTYGLTEAASQAATLRPDDARFHPGSSGQPLPTTEIRIERDGQRLASDEIGEIAIRGQTLFRGYFRERASSFGDDGWFRTGDLGRLDVEGHLFVSDRRDDLIVSGGENVYPAEVEAALLRHPGIVDAAVVAAPDDRWDVVPAAFVVWRNGRAASDAEAIAHCRSLLAPYKCPTRFVSVDALPRTASGKLLRRALRDRLVTMPPHAS
jgi:o-succinylbenzoate---CoA ligase